MDSNLEMTQTQLVCLLLVKNIENKIKSEKELDVTNINQIVNFPHTLCCVIYYNTLKKIYFIAYL